jgi:hypothetical protein
VVGVAGAVVVGVVTVSVGSGTVERSGSSFSPQALSASAHAAIAAAPPPRALPARGTLIGLNVAVLD